MSVLPRRTRTAKLVFTPSLTTAERQGLVKRRCRTATAPAFTTAVETLGGWGIVVYGDDPHAVARWLWTLLGREAPYAVVPWVSGQGWAS